MKCPDCGAEMIPGFNSMTFYCPNECDLKRKNGFVTQGGTLTSSDLNNPDEWVTAPNSNNTITCAKITESRWFYTDSNGVSHLFTEEQISRIEDALACYGWKVGDIISLSGSTDAADTKIYARVELGSGIISIPIQR